jgi:hypothetical protein
MQRIKQVSAFTVTGALAITGLLAKFSADPKHAVPAHSTPKAAHHEACPETRRELRFGWLKPGEEPAQAGQPAACVAVYRR